MLYNFVYDGVCDVQRNFNLYFQLLTNKAVNLFKWENLPSTVDERFLMTQLILTGKICFAQFDGNIYALNGNVGGEPNVYYKPQYWIVANPILGSKQIRIRNKDGSDKIDSLEGIMVGLTNYDHEFEGPSGGIFNLIYQTAGLLADNVSSINASQINGRVQQLWVCDNDMMARTVEEIVRDMYAGKPFRMLTQDMIDQIHVVPAAQTGQANTLINLLETHRGILQDFYNELGIGYQGNAKRERVNTAEIGLMRGCLDVSVWGMLHNLQTDIERVNELFGTDIKVDLNDEVFYEGSGNATLGVEEDLTEQGEDVIKEDSEGNIEDTVDEKNTEEVIEVEENKGNEKEGDE